MMEYEFVPRARALVSMQNEGPTRDDVLDNVTLYWLTNTAVSSARLYWESKLAFFAPVSAFPDELYQAPQSWTHEAYPKLIYYNRLDKAGTSRPGSSLSCSSRSCERDFGR
jgi:hypothetical protein